jgi:hypothetical protein
MDPERNVFVALLTNAVHPSAVRFRPLRALWLLVRAAFQVVVTSPCASNGTLWPGPMKFAWDGIGGNFSRAVAVSMGCLHGGF